MLNRGLYSLIQVYSSCNASSSVATTVHSTLAAVKTMAWVLAVNRAGLTK